MRVVHLIMTLLICLGAVAPAQESSGSKTSSKKKTSGVATSSGTSGASSSTKKKPTSSGSIAGASSSTASKSKPKPKSATTSSEGKTTNSSKEAAAKESKDSKEESETKKDADTAMTEKEKGTITSSKTEGSEKKDSTSTTAAKTKAETKTGKPAEEDEGADERDPTKAGKKTAAVSSITPEEIEGFETYPAATQQLIRRSLELTTQNLRYQFGSSDPKAGGMDCSGTMYRVLQDSGIKDVPRQSDEICRWVMRHTRLYRTEDTSTLKDKSLSALKPGDLLFWTGTYDTSSPRELPISHVMLYLGKRKKDGKPVVFGASDGRTYDGQRRNGVSVFDFVMPKRDGKAAFYGYGPVPGLKSSANSSAGQ